MIVFISIKATNGEVLNAVVAQWGQTCGLDMMNLKMQHGTRKQYTSGITEKHRGNHERLNIYNAYFVLSA